MLQGCNQESTQMPQYRTAAAASVRWPELTVKSIRVSDQLRADIEDSEFKEQNPKGRAFDLAATVSKDNNKSSICNETPICPIRSLAVQAKISKS